MNWKLATGYGLAFIALAAAAFGAVHAYRSFMARTTLHVVDLGKITASREKEFVALLAAGASEKEQGKAYELAKSFGPAVAKALEDEASACQCVIFNKAAIVGGSYVDLTESVAQRAGVTLK